MPCIHRPYSVPDRVAGLEGTVTAKTQYGYAIDFDVHGTVKRRVLGVWLLEAARRGELEQLPVLNV